jgi:ABC-type cobalamin transport system permease subunit
VAEERRGVAQVAYFFFLAATFFLGDALFLAGFDIFLAIVFPFLLRLCSPTEHVFRRRTST